LILAPGVLQIEGTSVQVRQVPREQHYAVIWQRGRTSYGLFDSLPAARQRAEQVERDLRMMGEIP
jgi:hypothetical protein